MHKLREKKRYCKSIVNGISLKTIYKMFEYSTINAKLTNLQLSELKTAVKNNEGTNLRLGSKNFNKEESPHELFLTQKQVTKIKKFEQSTN